MLLDFYNAYLCQTKLHAEFIVIAKVKGYWKEK